MNCENNCVSDVEIAYIGGGSRGWAWTFMTDLALDADMSGTIRLFDIDESAAKQNEIIGNQLTKREDTSGKWKYTTANSLQDALKGANFVVISILPGTFDEMNSDVHEPEKYGIYQSVGDTAGPGGLIRALRTIPMFVELAEAIKCYAPDAWVINYTNPMSLCVKTLYEVFPEIKAFGCCHEVFSTQKLLALMCEEFLGLSDVGRSEIHVNVLGVNHFTWFDEASYGGVDLFPIYEKFVEKYYKDGFVEPSEKHWMNSTFECAHRVKMDLFRRYGYIAAAGDRHLAEFMPPVYLKDPETVKSWKFGLTTVEWRKNDLKERLAKSMRIVRQEEYIALTPSGEEGILLIKALCGLGRVISNVNIPNAGQISNLPTGSIVETNAVFDLNSIKPVYAGEIPKEIKELLMPHIYNHEDILKASFSHDRELAFQAFFRDPLMILKEVDARVLFSQMLLNTRKYLSGEWF